MATLGLGIFRIIFSLSRIKDNETVRQLRWLRPTAQTASGRNSSVIHDLVMVLMVLMVLILLKELSCHRVFRLSPNMTIMYNRYTTHSSQSKHIKTHSNPSNQKRKITTPNLYFLLSSCIFGKKFITLRVEVATRRATHIQRELMR